MKFNNKFFAVVIITLLCVSSIFAKSDQIYNFPIKPGSEEWSKFQTHDQMLEVLQIPEKYINMSTSNLIETCLNYPLFLDIHAYNSLQQGTRYIIEDFNGLQILLKRVDAGKLLFDKYKMINCRDLNEKWSINKKGDFVNDLIKIEMLLSQKQLLTNFSKDEKYNLLKESYSKAKLMIKNPCFEIESFNSNVFLLGQILLLDYPDKIKSGLENYYSILKFLEGETIVKKDIIYQILVITEEVLGVDKSILENSKSDFLRNDIYTPEGSQVQDTYEFDEYSSSTRSYYDNYYESAYPNATQYKLWGEQYSTSRRYNCHGYAWYMRDGNINDPVWMGASSSDAEDIYWEDGSYEQVSYSTNSDIKVSYSGNHSACASNSNNIYMSKWGAMPLMRHHKDYCPSGYGSPNKFYEKPPAPQPLLVTITSIGNDQYKANASGGSENYTDYKWWYRNNGDLIPKNGVKAPPIGQWLHNSYWDDMTIITYLPSYNWSLKCQVTDSDGNTATDIYSGLAKKNTHDYTNTNLTIPNEITLCENSPNPFNPTTNIRFGLPKSMNIEIIIYSITGKKVKTIVRKEMSAGYHTVNWDATDIYGKKVSSGIYIYKMKCGNRVYTKKMVFAK
ncbi:MAG: T9SS type A sorting domain-containing protein [Candidatus Marinimicrobia bacterium]|nr:T9SS type A sorting domain-containing protein [Candidatus Neomarinimicrobiota bacterium]